MSSNTPAGGHGGSATPVSICVPSVRADTLDATIRAIRRQRHQAWELIVVAQGDGAGVEAVVERAAAADPRIGLIWSDPRGTSRARNAGLRAAQHDVVAFTDDDCEPEPTWIEGLLSALEHEPDIGVAAGDLVAPPRGGHRFWFCPAVSQRDLTFRPSPDALEMPAGVGFVSANVAMRRSVWERVECFDEHLGPGTPFRSGEDTDLWVRLAMAGVPVRFTTGAVVHHTFGARVGLWPTIRMRTDYAAGQGAVAGKMELARTGGASWRAAMWDQCLRQPLRTMRVHRIPIGVPRLFAFERSYRRCLGAYRLDDRGALRPIDAG